MFSETIVLMLVLQAVCIAIAAVKSRDPLHPGVWMSPMLGYMYAWVPYRMLANGSLHDSLTEEQTRLVLNYSLLALVCFYAGLLHHLVMQRRGAKTWSLRLRLGVSADFLLKTAYIISIVGSVAYINGLALSGGFLAAYSRTKGGAWVSLSGYISELPMLCLVSPLLYHMATRMRPITLSTYVIPVLMVTPQLTHAVFGMRRGTIFFTVAALYGSFVLGRKRRLRIVQTGMVTVLVVGWMLFAGSQRQHMYLGSGEGFDSDIFIESIEGGRETGGQDYLYGAQAMVTADKNAMHFWGRRYFTQTIIRAIPSAIWPTKYADMGMEWMKVSPGSYGMNDSLWRDAVGVTPNLGSAAGLITDSFIEFSWFGGIVCWLVGYMASLIWLRMRQRGGEWIVVFFSMVIASVYLPTQGLCSAFLYRVLLMAVPVVMWWRFGMPRWGGVFDPAAQPDAGGPYA